MGWFGAVVAYLAVAAIGATSADISTIRAAYLMMEKLIWIVILPLNLASLLSGLVSSLGTNWGLFRHYWVLIKLVLNVLATVILLLYTMEIGYSSRIAARSVLSRADLKFLAGPSNVAHSAAALIVLVVAMVLAVYKPRGLTRHAQRKLHRDPALSGPST